jgi:hypothetical protein
MEALKMKEQILLGKWSEDKLDDLLREASSITDPGKRIDFISGQFLNIKYQESTLIGDMDTPEVFVINLEGLDCFTYLDYVEALRRSGSFSHFKENLKRLRYRSGEISFDKRNHFFTDWTEYNADLFQDVTADAGTGESKNVIKMLNDKSDGTFFLPGIPCIERKAAYIPAAEVDKTVIEKLKTGDYIGIYSEKPGLDVTHVGIIIKDLERVSLRHASSAQSHKKVIDQDFKEYMQNKPGIIILRPKDQLL